MSRPTKMCIICFETKPIDQFYEARGMRDGRAYRALPSTKRKMRDAYYRRTYGISADDFDALLEDQGGVCAICCGVPDREASWHLDHDHVTGAA